ncbi:MAG: hypothetical protein IMZ55_00315, partial [Acidobacteria bacterium]|nr:hypothetical protein [Acidobacteriota bacterium]
VLFLPAAGGAGPVGYRLMYFRDAADPQNYVAEILRGTVPLGAWPGP